MSVDTYACLADGHLVFSDIRSDKFRCLDRNNTEILLNVLPAFRATISPADHGENPQARRITSALIDNGLLVCDGDVGKDPAPVMVPRPVTSYLENADSTPSPGFRDRAAFFRACLRASWQLRFRSLRRTMLAVEQRRKAHCVSTPVDEDEMRALTAAFHGLRPYYPRRYLCRFDSLALLEFLSGHQQYPVWVFGVKAEPFGAHCWIQHGACVLNDSLDHVRQFTPIMAF